MIDKLEALNKARTRGRWISPWKKELPSHPGEDSFDNEDGEKIIYADWHDGPYLGCTEPNAQFIVAMANCADEIIAELKAARELCGVEPKVFARSIAEGDRLRKKYFAAIESTEARMREELK